MRTIAIDTEYDYCDPFLATLTDEELQTRVFRTKILSQKKVLQQICERRDLRKVFHHATGDVFQLRNIGIKVAQPIECTLIASNLVDENYSSRNLKKLVEAHLGITTHESNRLRGMIKKLKEKARKGGYRFKWSQLPDEYIIPYAKRDPEYTIKLWYYWQTPLQEAWSLYEFEKSIMPLIVDIQLKGLRIDRYRCKRISNEYGRKLEILHESMAKYIIDNKLVLAKDFNPRSVPQIQDLIMQLGMGDNSDEDLITLKTRMPKTDKIALEKLSRDSSFFKDLTKYRFFRKHKGTYYDPLYDYYTTESDDNGHFLMYQTGAKTGRFSVELAQTFPKPEENKLAGELHEVRKCIIPRKGKAFLCKDYEQQEARLFCHYSKSERMIDIINEKSGTKGFDIYIETGNLLFGAMFENEKLRKALRFIAKTDFLGAIYGEGTGKLVRSTVQMLYDKFERSIVEEIGADEQWAYESLMEFYKLYPVREYMNEKTSELYKKGYIELEFHSRLMNFKRRYNIPKAFAYRGPNATIQGTAAYVIKHAMLRCTERIKKERWEGKVDMILQVHDELIFEVDNNMSFIKEVDKAMGEEMDDLETFSVPITTSGKWSDKSWGDVVKL
jgi:DNA polymerase I